MKKLMGFHALLVDDDPDLREVLFEDFFEAGAKVELAESGSEALKLLKSKKFDFVLSDMRMPNGDGRFLAAEILKLEGHKPLVFLYSGYNDIDSTEASKLSIVQIFSKPCSADHMIEAIFLCLCKKNAE